MLRFELVQFVNLLSLTSDFLLCFFFTSLKKKSSAQKFSAYFSKA